ncbi:MAG: gliding motility protein GldL [Bacteroidales bacterium]|nr:gliding motility protein GldL [Bacteroidales bacterium]MBN2698547.1 gliding motility protein GldL [Bacteroidales bacterium]
MGLTEIVQSSGWKSFMAKLYGFGASVVLIGALFKIQHWPGAGIALTAGLITEAIIFFFSAFEPLHEELDWTLVYPELAGMTDPDEIDEYKEQAIADRGVGLQKFDELWKASEIKAEDIQSLGKNLNLISQTTSTISDITSSSLATKEYFDKMGNAAQKMDSVASAYGTNTGILNESVNTLAESYRKTAELINKKGTDIAEKFAASSANLTATYEAMSSEVKGEHTNISESQKKFHQQLEHLSKNLSDLNSSYSEQVKGSKEHLQGTSEVYNGLSQMIASLKTSVDETQKYKEEIVKLSQSLSELNNVYGNMLSAMSIRKK